MAVPGSTPGVARSEAGTGAQAVADLLEELGVGVLGVGVRLGREEALLRRRVGLDDEEVDDGCEDEEGHERGDEGPERDVAGPPIVELGLVAGLADALLAAGVAVFGPTAAAARLEGSKGFTKDLCARMGIPTAAYRRFSDAAAASDYVREQGAPIVIKADGLAAGKGVVDFSHFVDRLRQAGFDGPLVTHGLSAAEAPEVAAYLRGLLAGRDTVLANIRDGEALLDIFEDRRPEVVFHAAALKHAPLLQQYPVEAWKTSG